MKRLYTILFLSISLSLFATTHVVTNSGQTFTPADLTIEVGDTVLFDIGDTHNVAEVDEATFDANGTTSNGGFLLAFGGEMLIGLAEGEYFYVCQPHANNGMKGKITVVPEVSTATDEIAMANLSIYPNPAFKYTTISFEAKEKDIAKIAVYNAIGSKVLSQNSLLHVGGNAIDVNVSQLPTGFYFVEIKLAEGRTTQRLIVK